MKPYTGAPCQLYLIEKHRHIIINIHFLRHHILKLDDFIEFQLENDVLIAQQVFKESDITSRVKIKSMKGQKVFYCVPHKKVLDYFLSKDNGLQPYMAWTWDGIRFFGTQFFPKTQTAVGGNRLGYVVVNTKEAKELIQTKGTHAFYKKYLEGTVLPRDLNAKLRHVGLL